MKGYSGPFFLIWLTFALAAPFTALRAQLTEEEKQHRADSLHFRFKSDSTWLYRDDPFQPYLNLDFRNAYVTQNFLSLVGLRAGINLKTQHIVGIGFYWLNQISIFESRRISTYEFDQLNNFTLFYEYRIFESGAFELLIPVELGYGHYRAHIPEEGNRSVSSDIVTSGFGLKFIYMPHNWIGFKVGGGYRYVWEEVRHVGLDGAYFTLGIRIDVHDVFRDLTFMRMKKKLQNQLRALQAL